MWSANTRVIDSVYAIRQKKNEFEIKKKIFVKIKFLNSSVHEIYKIKKQKDLKIKYKM